MKTNSCLLIIVLMSSACPSHGLAGRLASMRGTKLHATTDWRIQPSFTLDTVCFLNVLTGDPFYVQYYKDEYAQFEPKLTPAARAALADLKRKIKDENKGIISAFLALYFSATNDRVLDDMLHTLKHSESMKRNLKKTSYYSESGWQLYESVREDLRTVFLFLKEIQFERYWRQSILPKIERKIDEIRKNLPKYNVINEVERLFGFRLASNGLTVYLLNYSQPHGIRVTGLRFLTDATYPFRIVLRNAVHEPMHPPYNLAHDSELKETLDSLRADTFLMDKVTNHNPAFGYNSFEGFIEEDCVQALEQLINEKLKVGLEAHTRWKENDDGMHVFAVALYSVMKEEHFNGEHETFRGFLIRVIRSDKLAAGRIKSIYDAFYSPRVGRVSLRGEFEPVVLGISALAQLSRVSSRAVKKQHQKFPIGLFKSEASRQSTSAEIQACLHLA